MKIALVVHCFFPTHYHGTEAYTLDLARHFIEAGHQVTVLSSNFVGDLGHGRLLYRYAYQGIPVICFDRNELPFERFSQTWLDERVREPLSTVLRELNPDVVHVTHLMSHSAVLLEVAQSLGIPVTATFTDFFGFCANNKLETVDGELCAGPSATRVNCLSCHVKALSTQDGSPVWVRKSWSPRRARVSAVAGRLACALPLLRRDPTIDSMRDVIRRPEDLLTRYNAHYRMAVAPTQFLRSAYEANGITVPLHNLNFGVDVDRAAKPVRGAGHVPVIGFVGQMAPHKGPDLLLQAFRGLKAGQARLHMWGDLDQDMHYTRQLRELAADREVGFMGTFGKDQVAEVMRGIDVLVIPSRWYENSPLVLLGALATHTPVVVSDVAGMTEFLEDGVNGMRFARGDAADLQRVLEGLLGESGRLAQMSRATHYRRTARDMALETLALIEAAVPRPLTGLMHGSDQDQTQVMRHAAQEALDSVEG